MDNVKAFARDHPEMFAKERYVVGIWFWEVPIIPENYHRALQMVDEIWVPTEYMRGIFSQYCDKPVFCYPLPILTRDSLSADYERKTFKFYFCFDFCSVVKRKNPDGLIRAFLRAFPQPGTAELLIKSVNGHLYPQEMGRLRSAIHENPHVHWIDGHLPQDDLQRLLSNIDAYASLHRSEGYGLTLAEAMASGKPVLATAHSGNMTFMTEANSFLVPFKLVQVGPGAHPYPPDALWAEADEHVAAELMVRICNDKNLRDEKAAASAADIEKYFSIDVSSQWVGNRIDEILCSIRRMSPSDRETLMSSRTERLRPSATKSSKKKNFLKRFLGR